MKELVRLQNIYLDMGDGHALDDYNLTVYEGEIVYLQGSSGSGKNTVEQILMGKAICTAGNIYIRELRAEKYDDVIAYKNGICSMDSSDNMVEALSILENLSAVRAVPHVFAHYNREKAVRTVQPFVNEVGIIRDLNTPVYKLSMFEGQLLCLAKVMASGAKLVIVNCTYNTYTHQEAVCLCELFQKFCGQGTSFLIISEKPNIFVSIAHRFQLIHRGMDVREWRAGEGDYEQLVHFAAATGKIDKSNPGEDARAVPIVGIFDFYWDSKATVHNFMKTFCEWNKDIWNRYINMEVPEERVYHQGNTVFIPENSAKLLIEPLSLAQNLAIAIPYRTSGKTGVLRKRVLQVLLRDFQQMIGVAPSVTRLDQLNLMQKKILSIYRWELTHPKTIFLENPFLGMDVNETENMMQYLQLLKNRGIHLVMYSKQLEEMELICDIILQSKEARDAQVIKKTR